MLGENIVVMYAQTYHGVPVWEAGVSVFINKYAGTNLQVTHAQSTVQEITDVISLGADSPFGPNKITIPLLVEALGLGQQEETRQVTTITGQPRYLYYRYHASLRGGELPVDGGDIDPGRRGERIAPGITLGDGGPLHGIHLALPLGQLPRGVNEKLYRLVTEVLFSTTLPDSTVTQCFHGAHINWRGFIDAATGAVLYLEPAVTACFNEIFPPVQPLAGVPAVGLVMLGDPLTMQGNDPFTSGPGDSPNEQAVKALRKTVNLEELQPPALSGGPQELTGRWISISDLFSPSTNLPVDPTDPFDFSFEVISHTDSSQADKFSAVNAYYHCTSMYRMLRQLELLGSFFPVNGPVVQVDPQGTSEIVNAFVMGHASLEFADRIYFGRVRETQPYGNALDPRVVLHEFSHVLLYVSVHSPNLPFAHSVGDSLAAIISDPCTVLKGEERFKTFPWVQGENLSATDPKWRRHGGKERTVKDGWGWGGKEDVDDNPDKEIAFGYRREQILSTTLFRAYQAIGGEASSGFNSHSAKEVKSLAARHMTYLIIRSIAPLPPKEIGSIQTAADFAATMKAVDTAANAYNDRVFGSIPGGTLRKVIEWSFVKQGLHQLPAHTGLTKEEGKLAVDVYIDADRATYDKFTTDFANTAEIWNRHQRDGLPGHQDPIAGRPNFLHVEVKNRGHQPATGGRVEAYFKANAPDLAWERALNAWTRMTPASLALPVIPAENPAGDPGTIPAVSFEWTPTGNADLCVLVSVSADGDMSNIDSTAPYPCATGPTPLWRLVPFDNNIAARIMHPVPPPPDD